MTKWTKRRVADLQMTIESAHMAVGHASRVALSIHEEWDSHKGLTGEEREGLIEDLTDAKIQLDTAITELEK